MVEWNQAVDQIMKVIDLLDNYVLWNGYETHCSLFSTMTKQKQFRAYKLLDIEAMKTFGSGQSSITSEYKR